MNYDMLYRTALSRQAELLAEAERHGAVRAGRTPLKRRVAYALKRLAERLEPEIAHAPQGLTRA